MKKLFAVIAAVLLTASVFAQSPEKMSYQAVIRNASNKLVTNQSVGMQISILQGSANGTAVYVETQTPTSNANGLVSIAIGAGTVVNGDFTTIDWAAGPYFIKTETDLNCGTSYNITGTSQLLSVPYALHAKTAESVLGGTTEKMVNYFPQSSSKSTTVLVSFSGNSDTDFSQASPVAFQFEQATPIYPYQIRYINSKKVDVKLSIPWDAATGTYDIIINPNSPEPNVLEKAFLIDWF